MKNTDLKNALRIQNEGAVQNKSQSKQTKVYFNRTNGLPTAPSQDKCNEKTK